MRGRPVAEGLLDLERVLAVADDHQGNMVAVSAGPSFNGLVVTRRVAGSNDWQPAARVPLETWQARLPRAL